jgi:hypothetical protein
MVSLAAGAWPFVRRHLVKIRQRLIMPQVLRLRAIGIIHGAWGGGVTPAIWTSRVLH